MKTIKFRGKRLDGQGWAYGYYAESDEYGDNGGCEHNYRETITTLYYIVDRNGKPELVIPESVGQWTGLVDRHGKEIYEGDIISVDCYAYEEPEFTVTGQVIMGGLVGVGIVTGGNCEPLINVQGSYLTEYILCGNCIDNPELMEVENGD